MSAVELAATLLALAYVVLAIREKRGCFVAGGISALLYIWIFWQVKLYMESALQVFYLGVSIYGWWRWRADSAALPIERWELSRHAVALVIIAAATVLTGYLLASHSDAARPWIDSFTTSAALVASWMTARKLLENWLYWIVIDLVSVGLYLDRGLPLTAILFALYTVLALSGYLQWRRHWAQTIAV